MLTISIPGVCLSTGVLVWWMGAGQGGMVVLSLHAEKGTVYIRVFRSPAALGGTDGPHGGAEPILAKQTHGGAIGK